MTQKTQTQTAKNVKTLREAHRNFNQGELKAAAEKVAEDVTYTDRARDMTVEGREEWVERYLRGWKAAFSDAKVDDPTYIDAGDTVVALATGRGTNDGSFGPFPSTGKKGAFPFCEVVRFNGEGKIVSGEIFYDRMTILTQLGHIDEARAGEGAEAEGAEV